MDKENRVIQAAKRSHFISGCLNNPKVIQGRNTRKGGENCCRAKTGILYFMDLNKEKNTTRNIFQFQFCAL